MRAFCPICRERHSVAENDVLAAAEKIIRKRRAKGIPYPEYFDAQFVPDPEVDGNRIEPADFKGNR